MNWVIPGGLAAGSACLMFLERTGLRTTLSLDFKGDVKRESRWFAQYGQGACSAIAVWLVWQMDPGRRGNAVAMAIACVGTSLIATVLKRLVSRVRPGRENAGRFLGPTLSHANFRESFPSSHSASAVTLTVMLATIYPLGTAVFWFLAIVCAGLRYLLDAHFPSDVLGGMALGYAVAEGTIFICKVHH